MSVFTLFLIILLVPPAIVLTCTVLGLLLALMGVGGRH